MSLLFVDSCDHQVGALITANGKWDVDVEGTTKYQPIAARDGLAGINMTTIGNGHYISKNIPSRTTFFIGFAINIPTGLTGTTGVFGFFDGSTQQAGVIASSDGHFQAVRFNTVQTIGAPSVTPISFGSWHYLEAKVKIDSSAGIFILKLDGVTILNLTNVNTQSTLNNTAGGLSLGSFFGAGSEYAPAFYIDSIVLHDDQGSYNNDFIGDSICQCVFPRSNGTENDFTQSWASWAASTVMSVGQQIKDSNGNIQRVQSVTLDAKTGGSPPSWNTTGGNTTSDNHVVWVCVGTGVSPGAVNWMAESENPPDGDNSYLYSSTPGNIDRYFYNAVSAVSVAGLCVTMIADKDAASTRTIRASCKSGATVADNGSDFSLAQNSYSCYQGFFEVDPNTSAAWTAANVNLAEFGPKVTS